MLHLTNDAFQRIKNLSPFRHNSLNLFKLISITIFLLVVNFGFFSRIGLLLDQGRLSTLVPFLVIWAISIFAVLAAAFQPNVYLRGFWAFVIAASSAISWGFYDLSHSEMSVFDILSLWNARHEAGRAGEFYAQHLASASIVLVLGFLVLFLAGPHCRPCQGLASPAALVSIGANCAYRRSCVRQKRRRIGCHALAVQTCIAIVFGRDKDRIPGNRCPRASQVAARRRNTIWAAW